MTASSCTAGESILIRSKEDSTFPSFDHSTNALRGRKIRPSKIHVLNDESCRVVSNQSAGNCNGTGLPNICAKKKNAENMCITPGVDNIF